MNRSAQPATATVAATPRPATGGVSVVMPVLDGAAYLERALESVRAQDLPPQELVVVDDGSRDDSVAIVERFARDWSGHVRLLRHEPSHPRGLAAAYRRGLGCCRGDSVAFLEQDDWWLPAKLSSQVEVLADHPDVGVVFSRVRTSDEHGTLSPRPWRALLNRPPLERPFGAFWRLLAGNFVLTFSSFMVRRDLLSEPDFLDDPQGFQDWMLLLLLARRCRFFGQADAHVIWCLRDDSFHATLRRRPGYRRTRLTAVLNALRASRQDRARRAPARGAGLLG